MMKAVIIEIYGSAEVLQIKELPTPKPSKGEVLVRILAASINPIDYKIRNGEFSWLVGPRFPKHLGCDFSGVVEKLGSGVTNFQIGEEVFGIVEGHRSKLGAYAEYIVISENLLSQKPKNISPLESASLPVVTLTVLYIFKKFLGGSHNLRGKNILIHGASGGVGTVAIQLAKHWGAQVTAVSSDDNLGYLQTLGADQAVSYQNLNYLNKLKVQDIFFDASSLLEFKQVRNILHTNGIFITLIPNFSRFRDLLLNVFRSKKIRICLMKPSAEALKETAKLVEQGVLKPVIERVFPLGEIQEAHRIAERGHARGKSVIDFRL